MHTYAAILRQSELVSSGLNRIINAAPRLTAAFCLAVLFGTTTGRAFAADSQTNTSAGSVYVTSLPDGQKELGATEPGGGYHIVLDAQGNLASFTDSDGNTTIASIASSRGTVQAITLFGSAGTPLKPSTNPAKIVATDSEVTAKVDFPTGESLVYIVDPDRFGIRVEGISDAHALKLCVPIDYDGGYVMAGGAAKFLSAETGRFVGASQVLVDLRHTRALQIDPPDGSATWSPWPLDGWGMGEYVEITTYIKPGQTMWIRPAAIPAYTGPVRVGLCGQYYFRPNANVRCVATLASRRLQGAVRVDLTASPDSIAAGDTLFAALLPISPEDKARTSTSGWEWRRNNDFTQHLLPLTLSGDGASWQIAPKPGLSPGVYRLRLWIAPRDPRAPESLGGAAHQVAPLFPDFAIDTDGYRQSSPQGDTFVVVAPPAASTLSLCSPGERSSYWRGEQVPLVVQARGAGPGPALVHVSVTSASHSSVVAANGLHVALNAGFGVGEIRIATANLAPGDYVAHATGEGYTGASWTFHVAGPVEQGMADIQSPLHGGPYLVDEFTRIGTNVWDDVMPGCFQPMWSDRTWSGAAFSALNLDVPEKLAGTPSAYDDLVRNGWMSLQGIQSRQISFGLHHSIQDQVDETLRKHLDFAQMGRRFPSTLGMIFDYDLSGVTSAYDYGDPSYHLAIIKRQELLEKRWQAAWAEMQKQGATAADETRAHALFNAGIVADMYRQSVANLHDVVPQQRESSSITADHNTIEAGQYTPAEYKPLDFRYMEAWCDQIYLNGGFDYQAAFWTDLLGMEKPANMPLWITVPAASQPGTHFRRSLDAIGRGATGIGYGGEGGAGLTGGWGPSPDNMNAQFAQEALSGELARKYGSWLNQFSPKAEVALLYSVSQGGYNFAASNPRFYAYYVLAHCGRPAKLVTEDEVAGGGLSKFKVAMIVGQTKPLPASTLHAFEAFAKSGGRVFCDSSTTISIPGCVTLPDISFTSPPQSTGNKFHGILLDMTATFGPKLRSQFGPAAAPALDSTDGTAVVAEKQYGTSTLIIVTNNKGVPFDQLLSSDQKLSANYRYNFLRGNPYAKDYRQPFTATLTVRPDLVSQGCHIYDVFGSRELAIERSQSSSIVHVDLASLQGRALLITHDPLPSPQLVAASRTPDQATVTVAAVSPVPQPVEIHVGQQVVYRSATADGLATTFAIGPDPGQTDIEMSDLITGETRHCRISLSKLASSSISVMPSVQIYDIARVRKVLSTKGATIEIDPRQQDWLGTAQKFGGKIGASVLFNPEVHDYPVTYAPDVAQAATCADILNNHLLGWRTPVASTLQWTGTLVPATVWNSPGIVFGNASNNRLIADLDSTTFLQRSAAPDLIGPGRAIIEPVASPFWYGSDAVVCLCSDREGMQAACGVLEAIVAGRSVPGAISRDDDGGASAERRAALGFPSAPSAVMKPLATTPAQSKPTALAPAVPVSSLFVSTNGLLAGVSSTGRNVAVIGDDGKVRLQTASAAYGRLAQLVASPDGSFVTWDGNFSWRHDNKGEPLWKTDGIPLRSDADGVWVRTDTQVRRLDSGGAVTASVALNGTFVGLTPSEATVLMQRLGSGNTARANASLTAVDVGSKRELWTLPKMLVAHRDTLTDPPLTESEIVFAQNAPVAALIQCDNRSDRDDINSGAPDIIALIDTATGRIIKRIQMGEPITSLIITGDGNTMIAFGKGYSDAMFVVDSPTGKTRRIDLPEKASFARMLSPDQRNVWIAGQRLYKVDLDTLSVATVADSQFLSLAPRSSGGVYAGTLDGKVVTLTDTGREAAQVSLVDGIALDDNGAALAKLCAVPLVNGGLWEPSVAPATIKAIDEFPYPGSENGSIYFRSDNVAPFQAAIKIPNAGRYRFTVSVTNPDNKIGLLTLTIGNGIGAIPLSTMGENRRQQFTDVNLSPGTYLLTVTSQRPQDWSGYVYMDTIKVTDAPK